MSKAGSPKACPTPALSIENNDFNTNWRLHAGWCFFFEGGRVASLRLLQKENVAANIEQKNKEIEKLRKNFLIFQKKFCHDKKNIYFRALFKAA